MKQVVAIAAALLALAATGTASAAPGDVRAGADTVVNAEGFGPGAVGIGDFWNEHVDAVGGVAVSRYNYPGPPPFIPSSFSCPTTGCASWSASGLGGVDIAAGRLQVYSATSILTGGTDVSTAGYSQVWSSAFVDDTITLSAPAVVTLEGTITAVLDASNSHDGWYSDPDAELIVSAMFNRPATGGFEEVPWEEIGGLRRDYEAEPSFRCPYPAICAIGPDVPLPGPQIVSEPFSIQVPLPAGTSFFNAAMDADIDILVWGALNDPARAWHGESALLDSANSLEFVIRVPDDVAATSGSGLLPIVGGLQEEEDTTPPTVTAPADVSVAADGGQCSAVVDVGLASADEPATISGARSDGAALTDPYPVGSTTITWTATDAASNSGTATQMVTVADEEDPSVTAPANVSLPNDSGQASAAVSPGTAAAADNCAGVTVAGARSDGAALSAPYPVGTTTIMWTATDAAGNTATATQTVEVLDVEAPAISVPGSVAADATSSAGAAVSYSASASDNVGVTSFSCTPASGSTFAVGDTTVSCTASDAAGNPAAASFVVHVRGAAEQLGDLASALAGEASFLAKVRAAQAAHRRGSGTAACNQLAALLNQLHAVGDAKLGSAAAAAAIAAVERIRSVLGC